MQPNYPPQAARGSDRGLPQLLNVVRTQWPFIKWGYILVTGKYLLDGEDQFITRRLFEDVGIGATFESFGEETLIGMHRKKDDFGSNALVFQLPDGIQTRLGLALKCPPE